MIIMEINTKIKKRVGKGGKTQFDPVIYTCSNRKCKQGIMANGFGISTCPKCGEITNVIPGKNSE
jgi:hypothetical protein